MGLALGLDRLSCCQRAWYTLSSTTSILLSLVGHPGMLKTIKK